MNINKFYNLGVKTASHALGLNADAFAQFAHEDSSEEDHTMVHEKPFKLEKPIHWSNAASLAAGDVGTRNEQMGLPQSQAV